MLFVRSRVKIKCRLFCSVHKLRKHMICTLARYGLNACFKEHSCSAVPSSVARDNRLLQSPDTSSTVGGAHLLPDRSNAPAAVTAMLSLLLRAFDCVSSRPFFSHLSLVPACVPVSARVCRKALRFCTNRTLVCLLKLRQA